MNKIERPSGWQLTRPLDLRTFTRLPKQTQFSPIPISLELNKSLDVTTEPQSAQTTTGISFSFDETS